MKGFVKMSCPVAVSIIIPTLNSERDLKGCLDSIAAQDYPRNLMEIIIADGGSLDSTLAVVDNFASNNKDLPVKVVQNNLKSGEAGKSAGLKNSINEVVCLIDSDNQLVGSNWLSRMAEPFRDNQIIAAEPISYLYRKSDGYVTRYCSLMGMNDPLCYFIGNYDRECLLSGKWTRMPYSVIEETSGYLKIRLSLEKMPTMGANGFCIRRNELEWIGVGDYLVDIDILRKALRDKPQSCVSKVKVPILHIYARDIKAFYMKQRRRISDFRQAEKAGSRDYNWGELNPSGIFWFAVYSILVIPLIFQAAKGYFVKRDWVWFLHPFFCILTFWVYVYGTLIGFPRLDRNRWQL
jgi:glycosyltransferase involved in cell wall biosynthesis